MLSPPFYIASKLLYFINDALERLRVVHGKVSKYFTVKVDVGFLKSAHQLRVRHAVLTRSCVDTLDPKSSEVSLLRFSIAVSVN